jgi:hypothetical protein
MIGALVAATRLASGAAHAETPSSYLLDAFATEERATHKRTELRYVRGNLETRYVIERVLPDRAHMIQTNSAGLQSETYVIRDRLFLKMNGKWQQSVVPIQAPKGSIPTMADLFSNGAKNVVEHEPQTRDGRQLRVFTAEISLPAAQGKNEGAMEISVDAAAKLPTVSFKGSCGGIACSFQQSLAYDKGISIAVPVR